jgi:hypothetical protein
VYLLYIHLYMIIVSVIQNHPNTGDLSAIHIDGPLQDLDPGSTDAAVIAQPVWYELQIHFDVNLSQRVSAYHHVRYNLLIMFRQFQNLDKASNQSIKIRIRKNINSGKRLPATMSTDGAAPRAPLYIRAAASAGLAPRSVQASGLCAARSPIQAC